MNKPAAVAAAYANVALVKYFGKRNLLLNLPAAGSLSLTLAPLETTTIVTIDPSLENDQVLLSGSAAPLSFSKRVIRFLDLVRKISRSNERARVETTNNFPTAAGLASSASGFAALTMAVNEAYDLKLNKRELSALARRGSGSASRSIPGGVVLWRAGESQDGSDSYAHSIADHNDWDLRIVVGVTDKRPKKIGSTEAMEHVRKTSPFYDSFINSTKQNLETAIIAVENRDLEILGEITEQSALFMHATALSARPGIVFWNGITVDALHLVRRLRAEGTQAYFTCDAGPQPKILCTPNDESKVTASLKELPGIQQIIQCRIERGARTLSLRRQG